MTYEETGALMQDQVFFGRVQVACLHFAEYISGEAASVPAHNTRYKWAQSTFINPVQATAAVMPAVVMEDLVQTNGKDITDADLQTATEQAVNKLM